MLEEMGNTIKTAATNGTSKSVRFDPNVFIAITLFEYRLNTSGKQLKDKTAAKDYFQLFLVAEQLLKKVSVQSLFDSINFSKYSQLRRYSIFRSSRSLSRWYQ
jgi:hypothetical protein